MVASTIAAWAEVSMRWPRPLTLTFEQGDADVGRGLTAAVARRLLIADRDRGSVGVTLQCQQPAGGLHTQFVGRP